MCTTHNLEMCAKQLLNLCVKKSVQSMAVTAINAVRLPWKSCLLAVSLFQKFMAAEFLDFCAKLAQKFVQTTSLISVPSYSCTACSKSVQYSLHSLLYYSPWFLCQNLPWNACPWLQKCTPLSLLDSLSFALSKMLIKNAMWAEIRSWALRSMVVI